MAQKANRGRVWVIIAWTMTIAGNLFAQAPADMPKVPILENTTYAVIRLDLNKLDGDAMVKWVTDATEKVLTEPADKQQILPMMQRQLQQLVDMQKAMIKAGAPVIYFAFNEFPPNNGPLIYAPVAPGGDPETVRALIYSGPGGTQKGPDLTKGPASQRGVIAMPEGVFGGRAADYQRIKEPHAGAPYLLFTLSTAPPAPLQVVAAPTEGLSLLLETMMPQIPAPVDLPMSAFTHGISSAVLTMQGPPDVATHLTVQASDPDAAALLKATADKLLAMLDTPQMQQQAPAGINVKTIVAALSPKVQENQLTIDLAGEGSSKIPLALLVPQLTRARQNASMVQSASQLRSVLVNTLQYASQNQNTLPESLDQLAAARFGGRLPPNPRTAPGQSGFVYVAKPGTKLSEMKPNQILIHENIAALPPGTTIVNAGYVDGHVDALPISVLQQRLAAQGAPPPGR